VAAAATARSVAMVMAAVATAVVATTMAANEGWERQY